MGVWAKSKKADPEVIARLQAQVDADPRVQAFKAGFGSPGDPWKRGAGGKVLDPNQLSNYVRQTYGASLPDGYDVSQDGEVVFTNKTPYLQQAAWAAAPIAIPTAIGAMTGGAAAGGIAPGVITNTAPSIGTAVAPTAAGVTGANALASGLTAKQIIQGSLKYGTKAAGALAALKQMRDLGGSGPSGGSGGSGAFAGINPSGGDNPFATGSPFMGDIQASMKVATDRTAKASPIYDALVNMAYGRTPTRYRGAAPAGYPVGGDAAPAGAYQFTAPQFGGR